MPYIAALFAGGKIVTGRNHGEAFEKLTVDEQDGKLSSGFFDAKTGRFVADECQFYIKKIILIRHAQAEECGDDPGITNYGRLECQRAANFLLSHFPIHHYYGFCCACRRAVATAEGIFGQIGIGIDVNSRFCDPRPDESPLDFLRRLRSVIESLPENSIIVSHSDFVVNMAQLAMGCDITTCSLWREKIPNCSITYVENHEPVYIGESPI